MICEKLIEAKKRSGLTNKQIAKESKVPIGTVNRIFSGAGGGAGEGVQYQTVQMLAPVLGISLDTLEVKETVLIPSSVVEELKEIATDPVVAEPVKTCPSQDHIKALMARMEDEIKDLRKVRKILFFSLMAVIAILVFLFVFDLVLPRSGWIQY